MRVGIIFRIWSFWIGVHYSKFNKRICINLVPCVTIWITFKGGVEPKYNKSKNCEYAKFYDGANINPYRGDESGMISNGE